jgi:delta24(24(1))-sterol reductase
MYYLWVCIEYHQGKLITPASYTKDGIIQFVLEELVDKVKTGAAPTLIAAKIYLGFVFYSAVMAYIMPGPVVEGLPLPSLKGGKVNKIYSVILLHMYEIETKPFLVVK